MNGTITDFVQNSDKYTNTSEQTDTKLTENENTSDGGTNTPEKFEFKVTVNGKEEMVEMTPDEIAKHVQLAKASTQKFQEASEMRKAVEQERAEMERLRKELESNKAPATKTDNGEIRDHDDDVYRELNATKNELKQLKEQFGQVSNNIKTRETEERINNLVNKYNVSREYINNDVLPFMAKEGIDNVDVALKALLYENGKTVSTNITSDAGIKRKQTPNGAEALANAILGADQKVFAKLDKLK